MVRLMRSEEGQAAVEVALVVPIFLFLLLGMVEFARIYNAHAVLASLAREGARAAAVANAELTRDSVEQLIRRRMSAAALDSRRAVVQLTGVDGQTGSPARVEIRYPYRLAVLGRFGPAILDRTITLSTAVEMRNE